MRRMRRRECFSKREGGGVTGGKVKWGERERKAEERLKGTGRLKQMVWRWPN